MNTPEQIARSIDSIQEKILDDGVIVVKRPDVWGQNRMSTYRNDFEKNMKKALTDDTFQFNVAGRIFRSEQAALSSQVALGSSLTALKNGNGSSNAISLDSAGIFAERDTQLGLATAALPARSPLTATAPGAFFQGAQPFQNIGMGAGQLGIEPTVYLDQKKRFLDHLNEIRRVNLGDDVSDSAGYGLYLFRVPVSIQPGECTLKGHGGVVTATVRPEFGPNFLRDTYRSLVIADLVDHLSPVVYEMIRSGLVDARINLRTRKSDAQGALATRQAEQVAQISEAGDVIVTLLQAWQGGQNVLMAARGENWQKVKQDTTAKLENIRETDPRRYRQELVFLKLASLRGPNPTIQNLERAAREVDGFLAASRSEEAFVRNAEVMQAPDDAGQATLQPAGVAAERSLDGGRTAQFLESLISPPPDGDAGGGAPPPPPPASSSRGMTDEGRRIAASTRDPQVARAQAALFDAKAFLNQLLLLRNPAQIHSRIDNLVRGPDGITRFEAVAVLIPAQLGSSAPQGAGNSLTQVIAALQKAGRDITAAQEALDRLSTNLDRVGASSLPSTRNNTRVYPIAPSDIDDVFLMDQLFAIAEDVNRALPTDRKKAGDVRTYLQHQLEAAYELLPHFEGHIAQVTYDVDRREFLSAGPGFSKLRDEDYPLLAGSLPGDLRGNVDAAMAALCWAIAVDAGQLDKRLKEDMKASFERKQAATPDVDGLVFYTSQPAPDAHEAFCRYVEARWPMAAFALDPVVDQQNIDEAMSQRRDLQLALAFSFAAGRTSFENLNRFSKRLEQDAETIALNKTVSSFSHGADSFGWRFYPRYQNPPIENSNLQTVTNLLWRGGPGRDYGMNNSKLEPGQRELTAVVVMPSFLERVKFEVVGNYFPLRDPDHMKTHSARMINQGRQIEEVRQALANAHACGRYRAGDLERLASRIDQVEAMLPLQTQTVSVPYESTAAGFQLFTPGSQSLVPELIGFEGADYVEEGEARTGDKLVTTSLLIHTKRVSLHESNLVAGGVALERVEAPADLQKPATVEVVSRDVLRVKIPGYAKPTRLKTWKPDGKEDFDDYVELYLSTPNGISNRLIIPYGRPGRKEEAEAKAAAAKQAEAERLAAGYTLQDPTLMVAFRAVGTAADSGYVVYGGSASPSIIRLRLGEPAGVIPSRLRVAFTFAALKNEPGRGPITVHADALPVGDGSSGVYAIQGEEFNRLASQLVGLRQTDGAFFQAAEGGGLKADAESQEVSITPVFGPEVKGLAGLKKAATNKLKVVYIRVG